MTTPAQFHPKIVAIFDKNMPAEMKNMYLADLAMSPEPDAQAAIKELLARAEASSGAAIETEKRQELEAMIDELKRGPMRPATFIARARAHTLGFRVQVRTYDGTSAYPVLADSKLLDELRCGDRVLVDNQVRCVLGLDRDDGEIGGSDAGEVARFERRVGKRLVEVTVRDHEPLMLLASDLLCDQIARKEVEPGGKLLVCTRRLVAFERVPCEDGLSHYRYLSHDPIKKVELSDLGDPPKYIRKALRHLERELTRPELGRRYKLRRATTTVLAGPTGTGKTHSMDAFIHESYKLISKLTGTPIDQIPIRVMRFRPAKILSMWLGESDKSIDRFFDEVIQLSQELWTAPNGEKFELPVIVILEECDSMGRERGGQGDQTHDRILTTMLERLDVNSAQLAQRLVVVLASTNVPHLMDAAFLRRTGGTFESFGRLSRKSFMAVLGKQLSGHHIHGEGATEHERGQRVVRDLADRLFSVNGSSPPVCEMIYVGSAQPALFHRRDFLTAALLDRSVQEAARNACDEEFDGVETTGVTCEALWKELCSQVQAVVGQLTTFNAHNYATLPEGARVAQLRRLELPRIDVHELVNV